MPQKREFSKSENGFTLVELMVTVFLTAIAVISIYRGYTSFSHSADVQEQIIEMQQNLRVGMDWLEKDLRRAGMNEEDDETAGFTLAGDETVEFTMDLGGTTFNTQEDITPCTGNPEGDGDVLDYCEDITYARLDPDGDGIFGLYRNDENESAGAAGDQIITNLDALRFVYLDEDGNTLEPVAPATELSIVQRENIRSVEISMVVRTTNEDYRYKNKESYQNTVPLSDGNLVEILAPQNDNFRRRVFSKVIKIRNAGL